MVQCENPRKNGRPQQTCGTTESLTGYEAMRPSQRTPPACLKTADDSRVGSLLQKTNELGTRPLPDGCRQSHKTHSSTEKMTDDLSPLVCLSFLRLYPSVLPRAVFRSIFSRFTLLSTHVTLGRGTDFSGFPFLHTFVSQWSKMSMAK
jgi:hypothetical protein